MLLVVVFVLFWHDEGSFALFLSSLRLLLFCLVLVLCFGVVLFVAGNRIRS